MYNIIVKEQVNILDKQIPVLLGGFGENEIVLSDKNIANLHSVKSFKIRERVNDNINRFTEDVDIIDLQKVIGASDNNFSLDDMGYTKMEQCAKKLNVSRTFVIEKGIDLVENEIKKSNL